MPPIMYKKNWLFHSQSQTGTMNIRIDFYFSIQNVQVDILSSYQYEKVEIQFITI